MLKRALFAGAALVISAMYMQGAVTSVSAAGPNVKPKVTVPKPRIRVIKPKIRLRVDRKRLKKKETVPNTQQTAVPRNIPRVDEAGREPAGNVIATVNPAVAARLERLGEFAQIEAFKEHIEDILGMLAIAGLEGVLDIPELGEGGAGAGDESGSDQSNIPGIRPDYTSIPTGGLASTETTTDTSGGATTTKTVDGDQVTVTKTYVDGDDTARSDTVNYNDGQVTTGEEISVDTHGTYSTDVYNNQTGMGVRTTTNQMDNGRFHTETISYHFPQDQWQRHRIDRTQDPDSDSGVVVWIPPSCGSAKCNEMRAFLKNPEGTLQQYIASKSTRVSGDREADPNTATTRLEIDQHGLVVSYGAESGRRHTGGGRVRPYDGPTRIVK